MYSRNTIRSDTTSECVEIPEGILPGAVIGKGGCNSKRIATTHRVRFQVEAEPRVVKISGSYHAVACAVSDLKQLYERLESDKRNRTDSRSRPKPIHVIAARRHGRHSEWEFVRAAQDVLDADETSPYRLTEHGDAYGTSANDDEQSDDEDQLTTPWILEFTARFRERMVLDVTTIAGNATRPIKVKAAFGQTCFALPDASLANKELLAWEELQRLELHSQIKPRWSNVGNNESMAFSKLVSELEAQYTAETAFREDLTVYMNSRDRFSGQLDISAKFRRVDDAWVPVVRRPVRVVHALYNIALDNATSFRIRVYSREDAPKSSEYADLASHLKISEAVPGDLYSTDVTPLPGFPSRLSIRTFAVKQKTHVFKHGLRFKISYMDASRTQICLTASLASLADDVDGDSANSLDELVNKVVWLVDQ